MKPQPYVGVTGCVNNQEVEGVLKEFLESGYSMCGKHKPMLGFLLSYKTLNGESTDNLRYPYLEDVPDMVDSSYVFNMIHYNSRHIDSLAEQVASIFYWIYPKCHALQLNIPWPCVKQVGKIKERFPDMSIVFQASQKAMENRSRNEIVHGLREYGDSLSYVLIDPSGGRGKPFDVDNSLALFLELRSSFPELAIGFAGGLNSENVAGVLEQVVGRLGDSDFCIDVESGVRDKITDDYGNDLLNLKKVKSYLRSSYDVLSGAFNH